MFRHVERTRILLNFEELRSIDVNWRGGSVEMIVTFILSTASSFQRLLPLDHMEGNYSNLR
jgi:hypothetical protein